MKYSVLSVIKDALTGYKHLQPAWRKPEPQPEYDAIIIGGGGHGLATAYYLAKHHQVGRIAVLEKGWVGSGNVGRNTTIVRANYLLPGNQPFYAHSLKLWENLEQELNYNVMLSQRGIINLYHTPAQRSAYTRRGNAIKMSGADAVMLERKELQHLLPYLDFDNARYPIMGGLMQPRAGTARHDAVAWGYARAADQLGVDIIENCEVTGMDIKNGQILGLQTTRGAIKAKKVGMAVAGNTSQLAKMANLRIPIESHVLQAFVSEGLKPMVDNVITFGAGHFYISQSDKGGLVFGGDLDGYNSYAQRGNLPLVEHLMEMGVSMIPALSRLRLLRSWGGVMDMSMDGSPIIDKTPVDGLYLNGGWCYGGFKATPGAGWCFAHTIANDELHPLNAAYRLNRFDTGNTLDENGRGPEPRLH